MARAAPAAPRAGPMLAAGLAALCHAVPAAGTSLDGCLRSPAPSTAQQDRLLRTAALLREELEHTGASAALVARSGLNLRWFGLRYSHAGVALRAGPESPWSVRQLYYACDESRPRLYDEGLAAFLFATEDPDRGFVSALLLPAEAESALVALARDDRRALTLQDGTYAANAHPYSLRFQNCNQWLVELLALAWAGHTVEPPRPRAAAQDWLREQGYEGSAFALGWPVLTRLTVLSPHLTREDHPAEDLDRGVFRVSMPDSIEALVRARLPEARRIEMCHTRERVVLRRGFDPLPPDCSPGPGDRVVALD